METVGTLFGAGIVLFWVFGILLTIFVGVFWPLMAWSAVKSLGGIHRELARINEQLPHVAVERGALEIETHPRTRFETRTGPLGRL